MRRAKLAGTRSLKKTHTWPSPDRDRSQASTRAVEDATGKSGWRPAVRGRWSNSRRPDRELLSLSGEVSANHLSGTISVGLYPPMGYDSCFLLV
jgi:hypothetical protein